MKKPILILLFLAFANTIKAQNINKNSVFMSVEQEPEFPGGISKFMAFIARTIRYPENAYKNHIEGKVLVQFIVGKDGCLENAKVVRSVSAELDSEALRVVNLSVRWMPGKQNGQPTNVLYTVPITFKIGPSSQISDTSKTDAIKLMSVDIAPDFPGGLEKFFQYIKSNENYTGDEGKVIISFIIEKDGSLTNISIVKKLSEAADKESIRLITHSPKWTPAKQGGYPVRVSYTLPIFFPPK